VKVGQKEAFQNEVDKVDGLVGAWYITKMVPTHPTVMPTDPIELQIIEQGRRRAEARMKAPEPDIWISFSSHASQTEVNQFRGSVEGLVEKLEQRRIKSCFRDDLTCQWLFFFFWFCTPASNADECFETHSSKF